MDNGEVLKALVQLKADLIGHIDKSDARQKTELLDHVAKLRTDLLDQIHGVGAQLHTQIEDLEKRIEGRLVAIEGRLKLQGGLVQAGSRAIAKRLADLERKSA